MKILYQYEEGDKNLSRILQSIFKDKTYTQDIREFSQELATQTIGHLSEIDDAIIKVLKNWSFDRLSIIDKTIIRLGVCEIFYFDDIPLEVSINEAIEIGKKYGDEDSGSFINGILDAIASCRKKGEL